MGYKFWHEGFKQCLVDSELSQYRLAKIIKCRPSAVCQWVSGKRAPNADMLARLCDLFGVDIFQLMIYEEESP